MVDYMLVVYRGSRRCVFFFNETATTEIYTRSIVGSVRCVQETATKPRSSRSIEGVELFTLGERILVRIFIQEEFTSLSLRSILKNSLNSERSKKFFSDPIDIIFKEF
eukprot:TRINITY_DN65703_c0_g1_i2.p1 TRINITY_DN65703_c0_g1~~TRINITY_DN65703_c0_g1_i2.p1  ORF type:complete len:108 (-),score=15.72 TRINITY_DN65703_c0_g1_i2:530-853(-)